MLSLAGGALGLLLAIWGTEALMALAPDNIPRLNEVGVDARVFGFTLAVSLVTGIIFGLIPGLQAAKPDLNEDLKEGTKGSMGSSAGKRTRSVLVAVEVALSLVLLVGAGLMIKSFLRLQQTNLGFNPDNVLAVNLSLSNFRYPEERQQAAFFQEALERHSIALRRAVRWRNHSAAADAVYEWFRFPHRRTSRAGSRERDDHQYEQRQPRLLPHARCSLIKRTRFFRQRQQRCAEDRHHQQRSGPHLFSQRRPDRQANHLRAMESRGFQSSASPET